MFTSEQVSFGLLGESCGDFEPDGEDLFGDSLEELSKDCDDSGIGSQELTL